MSNSDERKHDSNRSGSVNSSNQENRVEAKPHSSESAHKSIGSETLRDLIKDWEQGLLDDEGLIDLIGERFEEKRDEIGPLTAQQFAEYLLPLEHPLREKGLVELLRIEIEFYQTNADRSELIERLRQLLPDCDSLLGKLIEHENRTRYGKTTLPNQEINQQSIEQFLASLEKDAPEPLNFLGGKGLEQLLGGLDGCVGAPESGSIEGPELRSSFADALGVPASLGPAAKRWLIGELNRSLAGELDRDWRLPRRFADYELLELLGIGGMGVVFKARQISLDRLCAVKLIRNDRLQRSGPEAERALSRFFQEAQAAGGIEHENWVTIYDVGEEDGVPFYAMQLVDGTSLSSLIQEGPIDGRLAVQYLLPVCHALQAAHDVGIVHRDIKPQNLLLDAKTRRVLLADFGLAKVPVEGGGCVTESGEVFGSPHYIAPEQAIDSSKVGPAADIYGIGASLYHLLTGRPPFNTDSISQTLHELLNREPVEPRWLNPNIDADLETICLKCLAKQPEQRFESAEELAAELSRYADGLPIHSRPLRWHTKLWRWSQRNRAIAYSLSLSVIVLILAVLGLSIQTSYLKMALDRESQALANEQKVQSDLADVLAGVVEQVSRNELLSDAGYRPFRSALIADVESHLQQLNEAESEQQHERTIQIWLALARLEADLEGSTSAIEMIDQALKSIPMQSLDRNPKLAQKVGEAILLRGQLNFREAKNLDAERDFVWVIEELVKSQWKQEAPPSVQWVSHPLDRSFDPTLANLRSLQVEALLGRMDIVLEAQDVEQASQLRGQIELLLGYENSSSLLSQQQLQRERYEFRKREAVLLELQNRKLDAYCLLNELLADANLQTLSALERGKSWMEQGLPSESDSQIIWQDELANQNGLSTLEQYRLKLKCLRLQWQLGDTLSSVEEAVQVFPDMMAMARHRVDHLGTKMLVAEFAMFIGQGKFRLGDRTDDRAYFELTATLVDQLLANPALPSRDKLSCCRLLCLLSNPARSDGDYELARARATRSLTVLEDLPKENQVRARLEVTIWGALSSISHSARQYTRELEELEKAIGHDSWNDIDIQSELLATVLVRLQYFRMRALILNGTPSPSDCLADFKSLLNEKQQEFPGSRELEDFETLVQLDRLNINNNGMLPAELLEEMVRANNAGPEQSWVIACRCISVGNQAVALGNRKQARVAYEKAYELIGDWIERENLPRPVLSDLIYSDLAMGNFSLAEGDYQSASYFYGLLVKHCQRLRMHYRNQPAFTTNDLGAWVVGAVFWERCLENLGRTSDGTAIREAVRVVSETSENGDVDVNLIPALRFAYRELANRAIGKQEYATAIEELIRLRSVTTNEEEFEILEEDLRRCRVLDILQDLSLLIRKTRAWNQLDLEKE